MTTDLVTGRITSFRREQGFGVITLDDGREVKFDAGICTMVPEEGAAVRLRFGPAKWGGGLKALFVEPVGGPAFLDAPRAPPSLEDQLAAVQREHLVSGLSEQILGELSARSRTLLELLDAYYTADPARARSDGYVRRAGFTPDDDVLGDLAALLPGAKLPQLVRSGSVIDPALDAPTVPYAKADELAADTAEPAPAVLRIREPDGRERPVVIASLDELVELANAALRRAGDGRRVYRLDTGGAWHAYLVLPTDRALRLGGSLPFAPPAADVA